MGMYFTARALTPQELAQLHADPQLSARLIAELPDDEAMGLDLHKHWDTVRWVLTAASSPGADLAAVIIGGTPLGPDLGYGPARLFEPAQVQDLAAALHEHPTESLRPHFDVTALRAREVYPQIWNEDPEELWAETASYLDEMHEFFTRAAAAGHGFVCAIT